MKKRKVTISLSDGAMRCVDRAAKLAGLTRDEYIERVFTELSRVSAQAEMIERINQVFASSRVVKEQAETSRWFMATVSR